MILKRIRIFGFKSFYRRIELDFVPGITAVVGPNGCGKSNIVDAIRWVLGEQNPRVLRGRKMDDTIFKGTQARKPLNMSEVTLTFDNCSGRISLPYDEVTITRRLFRSGESEYLINDVKCRLKDVSDLILEMRIGTNAYSLIEQKMIDAILNGGGGERRRILEDAAGIVKYKDRKRQALRKLERTSRDLEQIQVLAGEVERLVKGLKRHAGKANRYRAYKGREKEIEVTLAIREYERIRGRREDVKVRLGSLEEERRALEAERGKLEERLREGKSGLAEMDKRLAGIRGDLRIRSDEIKRLDERGAILRERTTHRQGRMRQIDLEIRDFDRSREALLKELGELNGEKEGRSAKLEEIAGRLEDLKGRKREVDELFDRQAGRYRMEETRRMDQLREIAEIKARLGTVEKERDSLIERRKGLERLIAEKREEIVGACLDKDRFLEEIVGLRAIVDKMSKRLEKLVGMRGKISRRRDTSTREIEKHQVQLNNIMAQVELQQRWSDEYEGYPEGVIAVMKAIDRLDGVIGPVSELFEIEEQFSRAVEVGLRSYVKMVVTEDNASALKAISYLRSEGKGMASFISMEVVRMADRSRIPRPPSWVIASGVDVVRCDQSLEPLRDLLLGDLWIAPPPLGREDVEEYFKAPGRVVALDGSVLRDHVVLSGGSPLCRGSLIVQRSRRIEALRREADLIRKNLQKMEADRRRLDQIFNETDVAYAELSRRLEEESTLLEDKEHTLLGFDREESILRGELSRLEEELPGISTSLESNEAEAMDLGKALSKTDQALDLPEGPQPVGEMEGLREEKKSIDREVEALRLDEAALKSSLIEAVKRAERLEAEIGEREEHRKRLDQERAVIEEELVGLGEEARAVREERDRATIETEELEGGLNGIEDEARNARLKLDQDGEKERDLRRRLEVRMAEIQRLGLEENDLGNRMRMLEERIEEKYNSVLSELAPPDIEKDTMNEDLEGELREVRAKIAGLGHVNFTALDQYEAEENRLKVLREQRDDLLKAKGSLESTIRRVNRTARERFLETFAMVRENFRDTFRVLFRGGRADLLLGEDVDPLESEIDMVAQPFGKRLESVDLLSGGERALTALALLFAIYQVWPNPFCILDEADAALDDSNVNRLLDMLNNYKEETQFIVITHNKKTMSTANCLYGVTMEEPGISKVVSVTLDGGDGGGARSGMKSEEEKQVSV